MTKIFQANKDTFIKLNLDSDVTSLNQTQVVKIKKGTLIEPKGEVKKVSDGQRIITTDVLIPFCDFDEFKLEKEEWDDYEYMKKLCGHRYSMEMHNQFVACVYKFDIQERHKKEFFIAACLTSSNQLENVIESDDNYSSFSDNQYGYKLVCRPSLYKWAGLLRLEGKDAYERLSKVTCDPKVMECGANYVATRYPWLSAGVVWSIKGINTLIDSGARLNHIAEQLFNDNELKHLYAYWYSKATSV